MGAPAVSCKRSRVRRENCTVESAGHCKKWLGGCEMSEVRLLCGKETSSGTRREKDDKLTYGARVAYTVDRDLPFGPVRQMYNS